MNRLFLILLLLGTSAFAMERNTPRPSPTPTVSQPKPFVLPPDERPFTQAPDGAGLEVTGWEEPVQPFTSVTVTFPTEMVAPDKIDAEDIESPIEVWPPVDARFTWTTQTQGFLTFESGIIPAQAYRLRLREGLTDLAGGALPVDQWGAEMKSPPLAIVEENYGERSSLNALPQVPLEFNYPVRLADAAQGAWFQNRSTRERFPAEILLNSPEGEAEGDVVDAPAAPDEKVYSVRVRPREPLPPGAFYDLVVEGIVDATAGRSLPYPRVFPLGPTKFLEVSYVAARNVPLETPSIEIKFRQSIDDAPLAPGAVRIEPAVPNLRLTPSGSFITAEGDFDIGTRYRVTISTDIRGQAGYGLAKPETWGATFKPRGSALLFPERLLRERSALGLRFAFYQVNTGPLEWRLAAVPLDQLATVQARLQEFRAELEDENGNRLWTKEGTIARAPTQLLIPELGLSVVGSGSVAASPGDNETLREIRWQPDGAPLSGPILLEITGTDPEGRTIGNRALIYFGDHALTRKVSATTTTLRAASLADAEPAAGVTVRAMDGRFRLLAESTTDADGCVTFENASIAGAEYFTADAAGQTTLQPVAMGDSFSSGYPGAMQPPPLRAFLFTDRPLYRPGQEIVFKGFLRDAEADGRLTIPKGSRIDWTLGSAYGNQVFASGQTKVDSAGSWNARWTPPADGPLGEMEIRAKVDGIDLPGRASFRIEEFRNPPFSVVCAPGELTRPAESVISVQSQYFHGAANAGARVVWKATWFSDSDGEYYNSMDGFQRVDVYSEKRRAPVFTAEVEGETALDANGRAILRVDAPFPDRGNRAQCQVTWKVDITGPDGQTITGGLDQLVAMEPALLGVRSTAYENTDTLVFEWNALEPFGEAPDSVSAELFHVLTKTAKERLAPNVYRYRNFDQFVSVDRIPQTTDRTLTFRPKDPGRYVLVVSPPAGSPGMPVSEEAYLTGSAPSDVPVDSDTSTRVLSMNGALDPKSQPWKVGEKAVLTVLSPEPGIAWVSVETDRVLESFTTPITGNTARIELPIKPEYEPNIFVSVYLLRPGGTESLAGERFGFVPLAVTTGDRHLDVRISTNQPRYEPRETITGTVRVTANGQPVAGVDLAIYAVDDAILDLGGWSLPSFWSNFFPSRSFGVMTFAALDGYIDHIRPSELTMKGFVIGDGGEDPFGNVTFARKEFKPIILWEPNVRTDASGEAVFTCEAPDNLTRFRVVAVGQTAANQFGAGSSPLEVTKDLLIEPALPRFVREGDEIELRAVARQKLDAESRLTVRCSVGGNLSLVSESEQSAMAAKDAPAVFTFRAKASAVGDATVKFEVVSAASPNKSDAVEITLPIDEPVILRKESVSGRVGNTEFRVAEVAPGAWENATGRFAFAFSTTPWLAKLLGLPYLLEYPHGCFEQKTAKLLAATYLASLLAYLPDGGSREENYRLVIEETLQEISASLLPGGFVPYWPNGTTANTFVTIQTAWCVAQAEAAGFAIPDRLASELPGALETIVTGGRTTESIQAFALFVLASSTSEPDDALKAAIDNLYLNRDRLTGEGRAMLALALHQMGLDPDRQRQLVSELPETFADIAFDPVTFASGTRTDALCTWARLAIGKPDAALRERLDKMLEAAPSLSTQENLWLLVAFQALLKSDYAAQISPARLKPTADSVSPNRTAAAWTNVDIARLADFIVRGLPAPEPAGSYVLSAAYRTGDRTTPIEANGFRIERVVKNLTDPNRLGTPEAPFQLGDELVISYRFSTDKTRDFVALEDLLPAGVEVVNPNLALFGKFYTPPAEPNVSTASLSHSEMRDRQTNLYFDRVAPGTSSYSILARATAAGTFIWPATQIQPMYDSRVFGRSPSSVCVVND
ncbi:MAG: alpha-2-macroglobulin family protein [Terrimicrobiaceae bacterium]|nr:alpha-2-macroglobulin family protein [Terrimicrobiaceae bacterium]